MTKRGTRSKQTAATLARSGVIRIATRASDLAISQAKMLAAALEARGAVAELVTFKTTGDKKLDEPLRAIGAKGLFTKELQDALLAAKVDCCVHSLKDLPTEAIAGLEVVALLPREDPRDVLVVNDAIAAEGLSDIPRGSRVGTSSLRRRAQLLNVRPDLEVVDLRGNVPTRVRKVDDGQVHAAILAAAGLMRLGAHQRIDAWLEAPSWLPAAGQGAIAVEARSEDERMREMLAPLSDVATEVSTRSERALLAALDGGCQVPIGALAMKSRGRWVLHALIADIDGRTLVRGEEAFDADEAVAAGERLARDLLKRGGAEILERLRGMTLVPSPQPK